MNKSQAQDFAQKRNSRGGLLKGVIKNLDRISGDLVLLPNSKG